MRSPQALALLTAACAIVTLSAAVDRAQARPDFSGQWVLISASPVRPGYDQFWLGTEATIKQSATTFEIARVSPLPQRTAKFILDGSENQNTYVVGGRTQIRDSRATWNATGLLISSDTTTDDGRRWLSNILRWSLEPDGTLVVGDTEICGNGECPSVITALRFRKK